MLLLLFRPKRAYNLFKLIIIGLGIAGFNPLAAQDSTDAPKQSPFTFGTVVQGGVFHNFAGGLKTGGDYMGRVHLTMGLSTQKAGLWKNGQFFINTVNMHGGNPTATYIGDFQPISRNEAAPERTGFFELWYKHTIGNGFVLIGQHDMNSAFGTSAYGGNSIHSAFGMNPSVFPNAGYVFSIFPRTMPTLYLQYKNIKLGNNLLTLQAAAYAGFSEEVPKDPYNIQYKLDGNYHMVFEAHYKIIKNELQRGIIKLGLLHHTGDFPDVVNTTNTIKGYTGVYLITDQLILPENTTDDQGLGVFAQVSTAPGNHNFIDAFASAGINYKGMFKKRNNDVLFVGVLNSFMNHQMVAAANGQLVSNRPVIEANYAFKFGQHFTLQPDLQYIINPGANAGTDNAFLGVMRFSVNY